MINISPPVRISARFNSATNEKASDFGGHQVDRAQE